MKIKEVLNRFYVPDMDTAIKFYENILSQKCLSRFKYAQVNLEIAKVGSLLIISGSDEALASFRDTSATFLVDSIIEFKGYLLDNGAEIIRDIQEVPTGYNMTVRHFDGTIIEYVEHKS